MGKDGNACAENICGALTSVGDEEVRGICGGWGSAGAFFCSLLFHPLYKKIEFLFPSLLVSIFTYNKFLKQ
jgi:hypothetical protein